MKKQVSILFILSIGFFAANAQIEKRATVNRPAVVKAGTLNNVPPPPPPAPATKTAPPPAPSQKAEVTTPIAPIYSLTSAKVTIHTGNDNKEFQAGLNITLFQQNTANGLFGLPGNGIKNELAINSTTDFGLVKEGYNGINNPEILKLENLQKTGLMLRIYYGPTFFLDAWKIDGVSLTLEFKDQYGNLHPTLGSKTIAFNTAKGILNNTFHTMKCLANGNFTALTSPISEY